MHISTPKLLSVHTLNPNANSVHSARDLGADSEMSRAKRVEAAVTFWRNQQSFHLSPERKLADLVETSLDGMPAEFRRIVAEGMQHGHAEGSRGKPRAKANIFSSDEEEDAVVVDAVEEAVHSPEHSPAELNASGSISWSRSGE